MKTTTILQQLDAGEPIAPRDVLALVALLADDATVADLAAAIVAARVADLPEEARDELTKALAGDAVVPFPDAEGEDADTVFRTLPRCPACQSCDTSIANSKPAEADGSVREYRVCNDCSNRFVCVAEPSLKKLSADSIFGGASPLAEIGFGKMPA